MSGNSEYIDLIKAYEKAIKSYKFQFEKLQSKGARVGWIRFALFVMILVCLYQFLASEYPMLFGIISGILFIVFLVLIKYHIEIKHKRDLAEKHLIINQNEWNVLHQKPSQFSSGASFGINHRFAEDLDLFGANSLFHYINRCSTYCGKQTLADSIKDPLLLKEKIIQRQKAVKELSFLNTFRQGLMAHGLLEKSLLTPESLNASFEGRSSKKFDSVFWKIMLIGWPVVMIAFSVYFVLSKDPYPISIGVLLGLLLVGFHAAETQKNSNLVSGKSKTWKLYATLFDLVEQQDFESPELQSIHNKLSSASAATKKLGKIAESFDARLNLVAFILLNAFFLYDIRVNNRFDQWIIKYSSDLRTWINNLGRFEALSSLATLYYNHPDFILPELNDEVNLTGKNVGHPLIFRTKRIYNDFTFGPENNLCIITGSNMAGKSTFLRTLGINCILGQMGAPVCANEFKLKPLQIHSSIRVADNLQEDTSYFYAELKNCNQFCKIWKKVYPV